LPPGDDVVEKTAAPAASEALSSRDDLAGLIKSLWNGVLVKDSEHRFVLVNDACSRMLGIPPEQLLGKTGAEFFPEEQMKEFLAQDERVFKTGQPDRNEMEVQKNPSVEARVLDIVKTLFIDQAGNRFIAGLVRDITDRKKAEEASNQLAAIVASSEDAIISKTLDGVIISWNSGAEKIYGYCAQEAIGKSISILLPPGREDEVPTILERVARGETIPHFETVRRAKDGRGIDVSLTISPVRAREGRIVGASMTARDISAQKRAEKELQDSAKLRSDLIALINHEYANALNSMKLAIALLRATESGVPEEPRSHSYEVLGRAIERLRAYTTNFLNLHRLESGKFELNLQPTAVRGVVLDALVTLRPLAEAKRLRLSIEIDFLEALPVAVRADKECLSLIVSNLVMNAVKYTPDGGAVTIRIAREGQSPSVVALSVSDTGIGISAQDLGKISSGFYRTQKSQELAKGFGVGLMIVNQLLGLHGSRLEMESAPGKGSRFSFRLPLWKDDERVR